MNPTPWRALVRGSVRRQLVPGHSVRRRLHLAPPFLLDDYVPRYQTLSSRDSAKKRSLAYAHLRNCNLCPRECGVNRYETTGMCLIGDGVKVNVIAPHFGEGSWPIHASYSISVAQVICTAISPPLHPPAARQFPPQAASYSHSHVADARSQNPVFRATMAAGPFS